MARPISPPKKSIALRAWRRNSRNGQTGYSHQMLGAALVHPDRKEVIPLCPEPIINQDGDTKNDCERNASRRWRKRFRQEHPHLPVIVVEDGLAANAPHLRDLREAHVHYIIGVKPGDHAFLFQHLHEADAAPPRSTARPASGSRTGSRKSMNGSAPICTAWSSRLSAITSAPAS